MAHELETHGDKAAFAAARTPAWHRLGTIVEDYMTAEQVLQAAYLSHWNLRKASLLAEDEETGELVPVSDRFAVVRDNPFEANRVDALGVVGGSYNIVQNEALTEFLDTLVDESGAHFDSAGSIKGGRQVFVSMKIPDHISVGNADPVDSYIVAMTSHDGGMSTRILTTPIRVVCQNTMNLALKDAKNVFKVRHNERANKVFLSEARRALDVSFNYLDEFQVEAEQLINTTMTQVQFEELITENFGADGDAPEAVQTRADNKLAEMTRLFADSNTHEDVRGTAWAGLNALTEWYDYFSPVRTSIRDEEETRAIKSVEDLTGFKTKALNLIQEFAGV